MQTILGAGGSIGLEMAYQYDRDYDFRSDKFNLRFGFEPTGYVTGIKAIVDADYGSGGTG